MRRPERDGDGECSRARLVRATTVPPCNLTSSYRQLMPVPHVHPRSITRWNRSKTNGISSSGILLPVHGEHRGGAALQTGGFALERELEGVETIENDLPYRVDVAFRRLCRPRSGRDRSVGRLSERAHRLLRFGGSVGCKWLTRPLLIEKMSSVFTSFAGACLRCTTSCSR